MANEASADPALTESLHETLLPLLRRLNAQRTISAGKMGVLRHLAERGHATTTELAAVVNVSPQAISLAVRELERLQFVVRTPDAEDRRRTWFELTDAGRQKLDLESAASRDWLGRATTERLTADERKTLAAAIPILGKLGAEPSLD